MNGFASLFVPNGLLVLKRKRFYSVFECESAADSLGWLERRREKAFVASGKDRSGHFPVGNVEGGVEIVFPVDTIFGGNLKVRKVRKKRTLK